MSANPDVPVYMIAGFLDSGKTTFLRSVLTSDGLCDGARTVVVCCEEGEEELDEEALKKLNVRVAQIEDRDGLTAEALQKIDSRFQPEQVIVEYNGMWEIADFDAALPKNWVLYQIVHTVDSTTFETYTANMASLMMEKLRNADMIIFNRCNAERREILRKRNIKMLNRRAVIYLDFEDGSTEDYDPGVPPFDMSTPVLDLSDDDYGAWYTDVMDHPDRYEGHLVRYRGMVAQSARFPKGSFVSGRFAMVCCAKDAQFFGMIVMTPDCRKFKSRDWVWVTAAVKVEKQPLFNNEPGPVLYAEKVEKAEPPAEELITF